MLVAPPAPVAPAAPAGTPQRYTVMHVHFAGAWGSPRRSPPGCFLDCEQRQDPVTGQPYCSYENNAAMQVVTSINLRHSCTAGGNVRGTNPDGAARVE